MAAFNPFKGLMGRKGQPAAPNARKPSSAEIDPADLARLVALMSRLLEGLDKHPGLAGEKLDAMQWAALASLATPGKMTEKQLVKALGVLGKRGREIVASLQKADKISRSPAGEGAAAGIELTAAGAASLARANAALMPSLAAALQGRERSLAGAAKQIRPLLRLTGPSKPR